MKALLFAVLVLVLAVSLGNVSGDDRLLCIEESNEGARVPDVMIVCFENESTNLTVDSLVTSGTTRSSDGCVTLEYGNNENTTSRPSTNLSCIANADCFPPTRFILPLSSPTDSSPATNASSTVVILDKNSTFCGTLLYNGCGPESLPAVFRALASQFSDFRDACNWHDTCYTKCTNTRSQCDDAFLADMYHVCGRSSSEGNCRRLANLFHAAVVVGGETPCRLVRQQFQDQCSADEVELCLV